MLLTLQTEEEAKELRSKKRLRRGAPGRSGTFQGHIPNGSMCCSFLLAEPVGHSEGKSMEQLVWSLLDDRQPLHIPQSPGTTSNLFEILTSLAFAVPSILQKPVSCRLWSWYLMWLMSPCPCIKLLNYHIAVISCHDSQTQRPTPFFSLHAHTSPMAVG